MHILGPIIVFVFWVIHVFSTITLVYSTTMYEPSLYFMICIFLFLVFILILLSFCVVAYSVLVVLGDRVKM